MIDRETWLETWLLLAERLRTIRRLREEAEEERERITLVFDSHDQATVLTVEPR